MAFWEVHGPLGGLSFSAALRGREGRGGAMRVKGGRGGAVAVVMVMVGRWGWAPLLPPHGHVKVAFYRVRQRG